MSSADIYTFAKAPLLVMVVHGFYRDSGKSKCLISIFS